MLSEIELLDAVNSLKIGKSPGHDEIDSHVVKQSYIELKETLLFSFNLSLESGKFRIRLKLQKKFLFLSLAQLKTWEIIDEYLSCYAFRKFLNV